MAQSNEANEANESGERSGGGRTSAAKGRTAPSKAERREAARREAHQKKVRAAVVVGVGVVLLLAAVAFAVADAIEVGGDGVTDAEAFDLPALDADLDPDGDGRIALADFSGTPTVVNFFASWCIQCDEELPAFRETANATAGEVDFVFVNSNESDDWRPMAERNEILDFPLAKDIRGDNENGLYRSLGGAGGMPITAFYDATGRLVDISFGALNAPQIERRLASLYGVTV